ncbi:chloroplast division protein ARC6 [Klebsormidium nitens]|uniref:Chloroplast division protein ARC6 n=1 Tax=Klebsormidium nitens TaxID=105231 RepID=A0A0U9HR06_KLENI|nr:chloroplast division protein ARC6 [Klebsormidium nitens]|eukprot:GAQ80447.1 chloroplast division protein ARC6 [Klebsormidium nitens]
MERKPELVEDADGILSKLARELQQDPDSADAQRIDVALERAMCCLLLGHVDDARAHLGLNTTPPTGSLDIADYVYAHSESSPDLLPGLCSLLERWLKEALLTSYREASQINSAIIPYFEDPHVKGYLEKLQQGSILLAFGKAIRGGVRLAARIASLPIRTIKWIGRSVEGLAAGLKDRASAVTVAASGNDTVEETWRGANVLDGRSETREVGMRSDNQSLGVDVAKQSRGSVSSEAIDQEREDFSNGGVGMAQGPPFLAPPEQLPRGIPATGKLKDLDLERFLARGSDGFAEFTAAKTGDEMDGTETSGALESEPTVGFLIERGAEGGDVAGVGVEDNGAVSSKPKPVDPVYQNRSNVVILVGGALLVAAIASAVLKPSRKPAANQLLQTPVTAKTVAPLPKLAQQQIVPKPLPMTPPDVDIRMPPMDSVLAEGIIRRWQKAKAGALGRRGDISGLRDVLDGAMLAEWTARARDFSKTGKRWDYDLRGINVESVQVSNRGREAVVGVTLQERATEFDASQQAIDSYEEEYRAKYELRFIRGAGWRIISGTVLT